MATEVALEQEAEEDWKLNNRRIAIFARMLERVAENHEVTRVRSVEPGLDGAISFLVDRGGPKRRSFMEISTFVLEGNSPEAVTFFAEAGGAGNGIPVTVHSPNEVTSQLLSRMIQGELDRSNEGRRSR